MQIVFDVQHLYYLPQYLPVANALAGSATVSFVFYRPNEVALNQVMQDIVVVEQLTVHWVTDWDEAKAYYLSQKADWLIFGNTVADLDSLHKVSNTALMQHGIGPKSCYYDVSENPTTVRFVEGEHRLARLQQRFPEHNFVNTGYAKLDPILIKNPAVTAQSITLAELGLDPSKPTLLYAPTFYPSSIEKFAKSFPDQFAQYNIIVKPHFFSLTKPKYKKQKNLLELWAKSDNVYLASVADYNLVPFMGVADVMLSDASSAIFEFAALDKPVIWCDFYQLRWSYRGPFKYRFTQRLDQDMRYFNLVASQVTSYNALADTVAQVVQQGDGFLSEKMATVERLTGTLDGQCSQRIANYLLHRI